MDVIPVSPSATLVISSATPAALYHPTQNLQKPLIKNCKDDPARKYPVREYFRGIYEKHWSQQFWMVQDVPGVPAGTRQLLFSPSACEAVCQDLQTIWKSPLPELRGIDLRTCPSMPISFSTAEEMKPFLDQMHEYNRQIHTKLIRAEAERQLILAQEMVSTPNPTTGTIVALDFETWEKSKAGNPLLLELGMSITNLGSLDSVETKHFIFQENQEYRNGRYCPDNRDHFAYGKSKVDTQENIVAALREQVLSCSFLVFHNAKAERHTLRHLGIEHSKPCFDTQALAPFWTGNSNLIGLEKLLIFLAIPTAKMHNAGNDSHLTLCAFVKLLEKFQTAGHGLTDLDID